MRNSLVVQALGVTALALCGCAGSQTSPVSSAMAQQGTDTGLLIDGGTLIDGNGGAPVPDSAILIRVWQKTPLPGDRAV